VDHVAVGLGVRDRGLVARRHEAVGERRPEVLTQLADRDAVLRSPRSGDRRLDRRQVEVRRSSNGGSVTGSRQSPCSFA
jgi:hypothetical protein